MRKSIAFSVFGFLAVLSASAGERSFIGQWKLNPEKSHFSHGELPKSLVITIQSDGADGIRYQSKNLVGEKTGGIMYAARLDGSDTAVTGTTAYDTASVKRVDPQTLHIQMKKNGAVIVDTVYTVAADGKSFTRKGIAKKGPEANSFEEWFDREP